ncbi:M23 family metallopeptidase [Variovorax sp. IB41]|uniref:M23 family metallopeptidase n=1 Tax=Variovorax sp. IB41 TaxID=2779370 RepID=UPI0018E760D0|nr:M23 family metallopeptidase [Variovorax sp. IB41]MBJ2159758.1 hypothetical protein [Variovorax sp. IB41]
MIISPPFLPYRAGQSEDAWLDTAMAQPASRLASTNAPEGSFPLSLKLAWHNGIHIQAPIAGGAYLPVRAVADGKVVFVHAPTAQNAELDHPLNYNPFHGETPSAAWTSDGFLVIEHRTEIGAAGAVVTEVVYYSVYMHLSSIAACPRTGLEWSVGKAVYRKEELGAPGQIYGHDGQIHFEICCNKANLALLTQRGPDWVDPLALPPPTADGRTDSVFGSLYVYLPAGTPTSTSQPTHHLRASGHVGGAASAASDHFPPNTLHTPLWVQITYENGGATLASYDAHGTAIGVTRNDSRDDYIHRANAPAAAGHSFEYDLYAAANDRHDALDAAAQAVSSPSGWYELLRFARNLGGDPLPSNAAHWRKVVTTSGEVWADLNAQGTFKFSDADFLPVMGWNCFDDDPAPADQRCDSLHMKTLIRDPDPANARRMESVQLARRLGEVDVRRKLRRAICRFPSEWDQTSLQARYGWLETEDFKPTDDDATGAQKWDRFVKHANAISFLDLPTEIVKADWRFHPREFVGHMRKCEWLGRDELAQLVVRRTRAQPHIPINWAQAKSRISAHYPQLSKALRKYRICTPARWAHFFGQCIQETDYLRTMEEYGGLSLDYAPYFGRGFTQLTWAKNYIAYGKFRSYAPPIPFTAANFPNWHARYRNNWYDGRPSAAQIQRNGRSTYVLDGKPIPSWNVEAVSTDSSMASDSGGFFWVWKALANSSTGHLAGESCILRLADRGFAQADVDEITYNINGGWNGRDIRRITGPYAWAVLNDVPMPAGFERQVP